MSDSIFCQMDFWALVISAVTMFGGVCGYLRHDRKLKEQERRINEYQLKQIEKEDIESKKAAIRGIIIKEPKGRRTLKIKNSGRATARNIRVEGLNVEGVRLLRKDIFPYELMTPQDYAELLILLTCNCPSTIKLKYIWDDEFGDNNEFEQVLTI